MERLTALLTRKLGPLPVWTWALAATAAILAWFYWRERQDRLAVAPVPSPEDVPADAGIDGLLDDVPSDGYDGPGARTITFSSNQAWARYVVDKLTIRGEDPTLVSNAISKILYGQEVTAQEAAIYNEAVRLYGAPPELVPIIRISPGPQPDPADPQPGRRIPPIRRDGPNPTSPVLPPGRIPLRRG